VTQVQSETDVINFRNSFTGFFPGSGIFRDPGSRESSLEINTLSFRQKESFGAEKARKKRKADQSARKQFGALNRYILRWP
jgi:DNA-binding transcriptional regulator WhiA